jgi:phosphatidylserine/phosphatidylglycerophosphate/cardiolipin synthase-like enzyme
MSTEMRARIASDRIDDAGHFAALVGLRVSLRMPGSSLFGDDELASDVTDSDGHFELRYRRDPSSVGNHRTLDFVVEDHVGRVLPFARTRFVSSNFVLDAKSGRIRFEDVDDELVIVGDFIIREADAKGFLITLDTGANSPGESGTPGWGVSRGNRVRLLMDRDAFKEAADLIRNARWLVLISQLFFPVPVGFNTDPSLEPTKLLFDFTDSTSRPERLMVTAADLRANIRVLLHAFEVPLFLKIIAGTLVFPFLGSDGVALVAGELLDDDLTDTDEGKRYFGEAARPGIRVEAFRQPVFSAGVMHAKLMFVDGDRALSIGSPFGQSYVDAHDHPIDAPSRGDSEGFPKHDAGFAVTGPALRHVYETLRLMWNKAVPDDKLTSWPPEQPLHVHGPGPPIPEPDAICSMQIVRTLSAGTFETPAEGEKGILEAYLRAINSASDFVYLETQYFTNDAIGHALVNAMKRNHKLQVIVLLNIQPDVPLYPFKQRRLITRIRREIAPGNQQFGVFTRWTHETGAPRPRILPVYIHAKVGIVDDAWATIGSANLDGLSLDSLLINIFHEQRAIEVNAVMLNDVDGHPPSDVVDILRRKLWAEHLGFFSSTAPQDPDINAGPLRSRPEGGWLKLWSARAGAALQQLIDKPQLPLTAEMARVLPWPTDNTTHSTPRDHLTALGILPHKLVPLKSTRAFDFNSQPPDWKKDSKARMDY